MGIVEQAEKLCDEMEAVRAYILRWQGEWRWRI